MAQHRATVYVLQSTEQEGAKSMPYSGADDAKLPSNVKSLPPGQRAQWANVWNSAYKACQDGAAAKDCEGSAFRQANGVAKKSLDDTWDVYSRQLGQEEAGYSPTGGSDSKACSNCHWFSSPDGCIIVSGDIASNGVSAQWRARAEYVPQPMPVEVTNWPLGTSEKALEGCECAACVADDDAGELGVKANWTAATFKGLPDASFAGAGRHFPYKDAEGALNHAWHMHSLSVAPPGSKALAVLEHGGPLGIKERVATLWHGQAPKGTPAPPVNLGVEYPAQGAVRVVKALGPEGAPEYRAFLIYSNNFMDRHGQIIREAAHKDYEDWVDEHKLYPEFWLWHTEGTAWGQADQIAQVGHFMVASGPVHKDYEHIAETLAATPDLAVSFGFYKEETPDKKEVVRYRAFEVSPLPMEHAANIWTGADFVKGEEMALTQARKEFLKKAGVSDEFITNLESGLTARGTAIEGAGVAHKAEAPPEAEVEGTLPSSGEGAVVPVDMVVDMMQQIMAPMQAGLEALQAGQKSLEGTLAKSIKDAAEDMNLAAVNRLPQGHKATEDPGNVLAGAPGAPDDGDGATEYNWLNKEPVFAGMFGGPARGPDDSD